MKYSFIIPAYNNKVLLKNTLKALNNQSGYGINEYEVIVVDDGSSDNTYDYIKDAGINYNLKYFYLERSKDSCRAKTRNFGWQNSTGEIMVFIDSDILVQSNHLAELDRCFSLNKDVIVIGNRLMMKEDVSYDDIGSDGLFSKYNFNKNNFSNMEYRYYSYEIMSYNSNLHLYPWTLIYSCNMSVCKKHLENSGGFDENFKSWGMEDIELGYSLMKNGLKIIINSKLEVLHQYHGERNDLIISEDKLQGYKENIGYFMIKHPEAITIDKRFAYRLFTGDIPYLNIIFESEKIDFDFINKNELEKLKENILHYASKNKYMITVNDYVEESNLDVWIQLLGKTNSAIKYFPASKRINKNAMTDYLKTEKQRQKDKVQVQRK